MVELEGPGILATGRQPQLPIKKKETNFESTYKDLLYQQCF